jgi:hypothetical protein
VKTLITCDEVIPRLLKACPSFNPAWRAHLEYWGENERGIFNDTMEFAVFLVQCYKVGATREFPAVFETIEMVIKEGDPSARSAAVVGVLESLQTQASHESFGQDVFVPWLGQLSRKEWAKLDALWTAGGGSLMGVVRLERKTDAGRRRKR